MNDLFYFNMPEKPVVSAQPARVKQPSVYLTRTNRLPKFTGSCVYVHRRSTDNKVFYVGMGSRHRAMATGGRNRFWLEVYQQHGRTVQILDVFESHTEARYAEMDVIDLLRQMGVKLTNCSDGGEGGLRREDIDMVDACKTALGIMRDMERARAVRMEQTIKPEPVTTQPLPPPSTRYSQADLLAGIQRLSAARERSQKLGRQRDPHPLRAGPDSIRPGG